jgi:subtilisin-like proprotein convertase family protein
MVKTYTLVSVLMFSALATATDAQEPAKKKASQPASELVLAPIEPDAQLAEAATVYYDVGLSGPATTIDNITEITIPPFGPVTPYPANLVVSGFPGTIGRLAVRLHNLSHTCPSDLNVILVGPAGQKVALLDDGGCFNASELSLTLQDGASPLPAQLVTGTFAPTTSVFGNLPAPAPPGPYANGLSAFNGTDPNGTWKLFVYDAADVDGGSLFGFSLLISPQLNNNTPTPLPDFTTTESSLVVAGITAPITKVTASLRVVHTFVGDLEISLVAPDGTVVPLAQNRGVSGDNYGTSCSSRTTFDDAAASPISAGLPPFSGTFRPETPLAVLSGKSGAAVNGTWKLRIKDEVTQDAGTLQCWSIAIIHGEENTLEPPTGLTVTSVVGNDVSLRWTPPAFGPVPSGYVLEGGAGPGQVIATLPINSTVPTLSFTAPNGSFFLRLRAIAGGATSPVSNEVPLFVNVPVPPSTPSSLLGLISNSNALSLAWRNTFKGGAPTSLQLDVEGVGFTTQLQLGLGDHVAFPGVPGGTYKLRLRAVNAAGMSAPSNVFEGTFPSPGCTQGPSTPERFLAYAIGNRLFVQWDSPPDLAAPTSYQLQVTGSFVGNIPTTARGLSGIAPPGSYNLSVRALSPCAASEPTAVQTVVVP